MRRTWLARIGASLIAVIFCVMAVGEILIHGGFVGPPRPFVGDIPCSGVIDAGPGCLYPKSLGWAFGFGAAGAMTIAALWRRTARSIVHASIAAALAWVPYFVFFLPAVWDTAVAEPLRFAYYSLNVVAFSLAAGVFLWWVRRPLADPPKG